jgi:predicted CopG family antitoxin
MTTTIPIDEDTRDKLRAQKVGSETYSEVIERLIQSQEAEA